MSEPLSLSERMQLIAELDGNPSPLQSLLATPAPGSNVPYVSKEENDLLVRQALAMGLGRFRVSEHDHRLALEGEGRRGQRRA